VYTIISIINNLKAYSAGYTRQSKKQGKGNLKKQKGQKFSHSATSRNYYYMQ